MVQSHCGILCNECDYKSSMGCGTCLSIENPFWGSCPIKACVKEKNITFCGECKEFPCALLEQFSYDKEQGDNGKRIATCKEWQSIK